MKIINHEILKQKPSLVIFDLDNTLYDYEAAHFSAINAVKNKAVKNLNISEQQFEKAYDEAKKQIKAQLKETASAHSRLLYFQRMFEIIGLCSQPQMSLDFEQTYWNKFLTSAVIFPHAKEFLDDLRIAGIQTALLTDLTAQIQFRKIIFWGLDKFFDNIVTSEEVGVEKPHREGFELVVQKVGLPTGGVVWMVGDNPEKDIKGAKYALNAFTILKSSETTNIQDLGQKPDAEFRNYSELKKILDKFN